MVKYPSGIRAAVSTQPKDHHASRGSGLEEDLNLSNQYYRDIDKALIYKKPTPIQVVHVDYPARNKAKITEAYYRTPSTTDYNGIYRGRYIDFEAKENEVPFIYDPPASNQAFRKSIISWRHRFFHYTIQLF